MTSQNLSFSNYMEKTLSLLNDFRYDHCEKLLTNSIMLFRPTGGNICNFNHLLGNDPDHFTYS